MKPLVIDLFCGSFAWSAGFLAEGWRAVGFDIEHLPHHGPVPPGAELVLQDVLTLHGSQFRAAACIVASPPCQRYSYMAMPWGRAKREIRWQKWERDSPFGDFHLNNLFDACLRIQREASEAAGHHIPMVIENVKGAQPWVGRAAWHYGSFYLWSDVPALMPITKKRKVPAVEATGVKGATGNPDGYAPPGTGNSSWFFGKRSDPRDMRRNEDGEYTLMGRKNDGGSWFGIGGPGQQETGQNPVNGVQGRSSARKAASALIAKIPLELSIHIAQCFKPPSLGRKVGGVE